MKKTLLIILALVLVLAVAVGCGNTSESSADGADGAAVATDEDAAVNIGSTDGEESFKGPAQTPGLEDRVDIGDLTLDDINILDESDPDANFRGKVRPSLDDLVSVSGE